MLVLKIEIFYFRLWRTQGIEVKVSRYGIEDEEKCKLFISDAAKLGPIEGIFIVLYKLAAPTYTNMTTSISNLDKLSRNLDYLRYNYILSIQNMTAKFLRAQKVMY